MKRPEDVALALSYVDNCLAPSAIADFERRLVADPELGAQVAVWRRQNEAIQHAFSGRRKVGGNPISLAASANLDRAAAKPIASQTASNVTSFPARRRAVESRPTLNILSSPFFSHAIAAVSVAFILVLLSANAPTASRSEFRAEAAAAWQVYRGSASRPPANRSLPYGQRATLDTLLANSFAIPGAHGPLRISFDVDDVGRHYLLAVSMIDAPAQEEAEIAFDAPTGGMSALWSDGYHWIALFGSSDVASTAEEAQRLSQK